MTQDQYYTYNMNLVLYESTDSVAALGTPEMSQQLYLSNDHQRRYDYLMRKQ